MTGRTRGPASAPRASALHRAPREINEMLRLFSVGHNVEALALAQKILRRQPRNPLALKALGGSYLRLGKEAEAIKALNEAVSIMPGDSELHNNLGVAKSVLWRWDEAEVHFLRAIELAPGDPVVHKNLAEAYAAMRRWPDAIGEASRAIELYDGNYLAAIAMLAETLVNAGHMESAAICLEEMRQFAPRDPDQLMLLIATKLRRCAWESLEADVQEIFRLTNHFSIGANLPHRALAVPGLDNYDHRRIAERKAEILCRRVVPLADVRAAGPLIPARRLRVGYMSEDLRFHAVGKVISELLERHDRNQFEITAYGLREQGNDELSSRIRASCEHFVDLSSSMVGAVARRIRDDGIDILVDLQMWTGRPRPQILAMRPAPVQVGWLGYPGTIGFEGLLDYLIVDRVVAPDPDAFSETLAMMPHSYLPADTKVAVPAAPSRRDVGLPEGGVVFCSLVTSYKLNPAVFDAWMEILREVPGSVLWLSDQGPDIAGRLQNEAKTRGVAPERLNFAVRDASFSEHYARFQLADLMLDPWPYNGHSTAIDALWSGVPVLSLLGETFAGRVGASLLTTAGITEMIAKDPAEYVAKAVQFGQDDSIRQRIRGAVALARTGPLFDMERFARDLESLYRQMWADACEGRRRPISA